MKESSFIIHYFNLQIFTIIIHILINLARIINHKLTIEDIMAVHKPFRADIIVIKAFVIKDKLIINHMLIVMGRLIVIHMFIIKVRITVAFR